MVLWAGLILSLVNPVFADTGCANSGACGGCEKYAIVSDNNESLKVEVEQVDIDQSSEGDIHVDNASTTTRDGIETVSTDDEEFESTGSEFVAMDETSDDQFEQLDDDEFTDFDESDSFKHTEMNQESHSNDSWFLYKLTIIFSLVIIVGIFIKNVTFRRLRPFFLIIMLVWLGFIEGGCPCMISSMQHTVLGLLGDGSSWIKMLWFLGLIPLSYVFGRVWCGWLCHLGALQEFLYKSSRLNVLKAYKSQRIIKWIQISVFVILLAQIIITRANIFIHYDPFKVAFNLFSANITGYILLGILILSSVLIYRPFCRAFCPVGLILGWVSYIPGARSISRNDACIDCIRCSNDCKQNAITYEDKRSRLTKCDCIACGECLDSCKKNAISFSRKFRK